MCGICGIFSLEPNPSLEHRDITPALETLRQRGPEVQAQFNSNRAVLGHTRLSIIDTSDAANQPFTDPSGRFTLVFNGEIYNFRELRYRLHSQGCQFHTQSDTEVLLHHLIYNGVEGITSLDGFFAFAFYDRLERFLIIARDRFGKKPLYYFEDQSSFRFASEMKALIKLDIPRKIDYSSLNIYFQLNYIPGPWSIFEGVKQLQPGHYMVIESKVNMPVRYYKIAEPGLSYLQKPTYDEAQRALQSKLKAAVVKRLVSDVPLGAFLSGGIDSSIVVALASKHVQKLSTFSIGFADEPMFDETQYARLVANMHKTDHTVFSLNNQNLFDCLYDVLDYIDEPFADSSALAVFILSKYTRQKVTVALSGDGADEMLGGYNKHMAHLKALSGGLAVGVLPFVAPFLAKLPQSRNTPVGNKIRQLHRFGIGAGMKHPDRYWRWAALADEKYPEELLLNSGPSDEYRFRKEFLTQAVRNDSGINGILRNDMDLVLVNDMLTKVDRMSMANSLEVRVPFLDSDLVDFVFGLPSEWKIDGLQRKKILRDAFRKDLPVELYSRPKQGFEVPLLGWFRTELRDKIENLWLDDEFIRCQGIFNPKVINKLKKQLFSINAGEIHANIWALVVFQHWYNRYYSPK